MTASLLPELIVTEGDEEVQYVLMELPSSIADSMTPGMSITLEGLESDQPTLRLGNDTLLQGEYEEPLGSILFYQCSSAPNNPEELSTSTRGTPPQTGAVAGAGTSGSTSVKYRGTCESKLVFRQPLTSAQQQLQRGRGGARAQGSAARAVGTPGT